MSEKPEATGTKFTVMKQLTIARSINKLMTWGASPRGCWFNQGEQSQASGIMTSAIN